MIAAIELKHNVVWGIGATKAEAIADANNEIKTKTFNPGIKPQELEFVPMQEDAVLTGDGFELFEYCITDNTAANNEPAQIGLFQEQTV